MLKKPIRFEIYLDSTRIASTECRVITKDFCKGRKQLELVELEKI